MERKPITPLLSQIFTWSGIIFFGSIVGIFLDINEKLSDDAGMLIFLMFPVAGFTMLISLGIIAHRLGRRWIVWIGLCFIIPFGIIFIYPLMLNHIRVARNSQSD